MLSNYFYKRSKLDQERLINSKYQHQNESPNLYEKATERNFILDKIASDFDMEKIIETVYGRFSNFINYESKDGKVLSLKIMEKNDEGLLESELMNIQQ